MRMILHLLVILTIMWIAVVHWELSVGPTSPILERTRAAWNLLLKGI